MNHQDIPAGDLRNGHLLRLGVSTNYVKVASTEIRGGQVDVTIYNGSTPYPRPTLHYRADETVQVSLLSQPGPVTGCGIHPEIGNPACQTCRDHGAPMITDNWPR